MKKLILIIVFIVGGLYYYNNKSEKKEELFELSIENKVVKVTGVVKSNFKILNKGFYELQVSNTKETIMVISSRNTPKLNSKITQRLKQIDIITINDKKFSLFEAVD